MPTKNEIDSRRDQQEVDPGTETRLEFDNLLDADAQSELRNFYGALEKSRGCKTVLVGYTPPRD